MPVENDVILTAVGVGLLLLLLILLASMRRVPEGFAYTVERFGRYVRTLEPGLRWVLPVAERIGARQDLRERRTNVVLADLLTRDRISIEADMTCFFQVVDPARASYEVEQLDDGLTALLGVTLRNQAAAHDLDTLLAARSRLGAELLAACESTAESWGVHLTRVELDALKLPEALLKAVAAERSTELERRTVVLAAEGERRAVRLKAEAERDAQIMAAEASARVSTLNAEARERSAEAEARATLMLSRAVAEGSPQALNYLIAQQYVDALKTLAASDNGRFVVLPMENGGLSSSLDGIRALAASAFDRTAAPAAATAAEHASDARNASEAADEESRAEVPSRDPRAAVRPFQPPDVDGRIG
ncbi:MAG: SPFH/Band 7/PHB domain protein [Gammaproteobacteria bacterium]|nr:SPFH/Band 7/PHB domain protein [Gammaproteobacteria bacterium]